MGTLWSMNHQEGDGTNDADGHAYDGENPDWDKEGQEVYYAHPYEVAAGENAVEIATRFGLGNGQAGVDALMAMNPALSDAATLTAGEEICIIPNWQNSIDRHGKKIC